MARVLSLDDIFAIERVTDTRISPDGARIAFTVAREYTEGENPAPAAAIWIVPFDGSSLPRRFTTGPRTDMAPRWSPDGKELAFLSDREKPGVMQVYVMPGDGGEARNVTSAKAGVSVFAWSPDSARIAYLAPDAPTEEEDQRQKDRDDAIHVDHDYHYTRLWVVAARGETDAEARALTPPEYQARDFAWRQGGWVVATSPTPKEEDLDCPWTLRAIAEDGAITTYWEGQTAISGVSASPDGRTLAWIESGILPGKSLDEVWVARDGEQPRTVASHYDGQGAMARAEFLPDGAALLLTGVVGIRTPVGRLDLASGRLETLLAGRTLDSSFTSATVVSVSADGKRMACALEEVDQPAEVYAWEQSAEPRRVSAFNRHLAEAPLGRGEEMEWDAPDGLRMQGVLIYPANYEAGARYPLVTQIHGGPTGFWPMRFYAGWHDWGQWLAAQGYAVLLPNPRGGLGRGPDFVVANQRNWGHGDLGDILSGVDAVIAKGIADPARLGVGGWSYGGYLTSWTIGHSDRFKAAVVGAGVTDLLGMEASDIPTWLASAMLLEPAWRDLDIYLRCSPITAVGEVKTPTLVLHGAADVRVPLTQGMELYNALRARGVPTEMVIYPREPHIFQERAHQRDLLTRVAAWFDRWLKGENGDDGAGA